MSMNKKILAVAIVGGLFATSAQAQVDISIPTPVPAKIASELVLAPGTNIVNAANALNIVTSLNYAFSPAETRHARIECSSNVRIAAGSTVTYTDGGGTAGTATPGAINGLGTNAISFAVNSTSAGVGDNVGDKFTITGDRNLTSNAASTCTYGLYDFPSQAAQGGTAGRIATSTGAYLTAESGYTFTSTAGALNTSNVESVPAFTQFVTIVGQTSTTTARLSSLVFAARGGTAQIDFNGTDVTLAQIFGATTNIRVGGDFSAARNADGTYTAPALSRVFLSASATCATVDFPATTLVSNQATFQTGGATNVPNTFLCLTPLAGNEIVASTYEATLVAVASGVTYNPLSTGPLAAGEIVRNGTELQAPLVQLPGTGWLTRMVLTNTGAIARPYSIRVLRELGSTGTTGTLTGSVPANGTLVIDLASVLPTFTAGLPRATLLATVAAPNNQIQGLYQIVNSNSLTISNHVMVRPGTN